MFVQGPSEYKKFVPQLVNLWKSFPVIHVFLNKKENEEGGIAESATGLFTPSPLSVWQRGDSSVHLPLFLRAEVKSSRVRPLASRAHIQMRSQASILPLSRPSWYIHGRALVVRH